MIRRTGKWLTMVLLAGWSLVAFANLEATVDHTRVSENDLVTLTVRLSNESASGSPDFSGLGKDFVIIQQSGPNQSSEFSFINGRQSSETHTDWTVTLQPRYAGNLTIPAISLGNERTHPITIDVVKGSAAATHPRNRFVFFETSVDHNTVYVQGQIIYTVKLFYVNSISGDFPPPPDVDNAVVQTVEKEKRYESIAGNRRYYVLEKSYAIYPQQSGDLLIPSQRFNGTRGSASFFSPSQPVRAVSQPHRIHVKPRPASFTSPNWLPARSLALTESWGKHKPEFKVGEPVNRVLTITAKGVASSLLPPFPKLNLDNAKTYADPPNTTDQPSGTDGIISTESTTIGIVPTKPGKLTLPAIRVPWWNTATDKMEVAVIPKEIYTIAAAPGSSVTIPQAPPTPAAATPQLQPTRVVTYVPSKLWLYILGGVVLLWLASSWQWFVARRRLKQLMDRLEPEESPQRELVIDQREAWTMLKAACKAGDASRAWKALFIWATARFERIKALSDLARIAGPDLAAEISALETALYAPESTHSWQGDRLLAAAKALDDTKAPAPKHTSLVSALNPG